MSFPQALGQIHYTSRPTYKILVDRVCRYISRKRENFSSQPTTDVKLRKSGRCVGTRTEASVTTTQCKAFLVEAQGSMDLSGSILVCHGLRPRNLQCSVTVTQAPVRVPTLRSLDPSFTSVVGQIEHSSPCRRIDVAYGQHGNFIILAEWVQALCTQQKYPRVPKITSLN